MAVAKIGVRDLAKELGITDRELTERAAKVNIKIPSSFFQLEEQQANVLRRLIAPGRSAAPARPAPERPVAAAPVPTAAATQGTVVRRRTTRADELEATPAPAAAEARPAAPASGVAPVAEVAPAVVVQPAEVTTEAPSTAGPVAPVAARSEPPRLRRVKASDLEVPPELQLRIHEPAQAPVAETRSAEAEPVPVVEAGAVATAPAAASVEVVTTHVGADSTAAQTAAAAAVVGAGRQELPGVAVESRTAGLRLEDLGKAIEGAQPVPSSSRRPTLVRSRMPEELRNIPQRPAPKPAPAPVATPAVAPTAPAGGISPLGADGRGGRENEVVDDGKGGRGRKLIYDRRRDAQTGGGADGRVRGKKKGGKGGKGMAPIVPQAAPTRAEKRKIRVEDTITVANLAASMAVKSTEVIKALFSLGVMATVNQPLDLDTVELIATEFGFTVENVGFDLDQYLQKPEEAPGGELPRSPVVTVMGHVDHGKTSLLDAIRKTHTANKEAGGITQHIGAYVAHVPGDHFADGAERRVVFLDTPGHEAFSAMRARGAKATDVIVLVVAADDGVMPQTIEALNHGKAAKVPMIVAVNKIDKPGADTERVRRELSEHGLVAEEWGGDTIFVEVSAKTGLNLDKLLDMLALQADILELKANPDQDARGLVIESRLEKGRGPVATLLVQHGTLKKGQYIVAGSQYCKVRAMLSDVGKSVETAGPSTPVEVIGFDHTASAGDEFYIVADEKKAKAIVEHRIEKQREKELLKTSKRTLEDMFGTAGETQQKELNLIVKADVHGSAEALKQSLARIEHEEVKVRVLHAAVGGVTESDINMAATAKGVIIAFNVKPEAKGKRLADDLGVQIRQFSVIYDAIDEVTLMLEGMLTPIIEENVLGHAEVRQIFSVPKLGVIAGSNVTDGVMNRTHKLRVLRGKEVLHDGDFASLKRFKDDVKEVSIGYDCGIGVTGFAKFQVGDVIECYELKKIARKLKPEGTSARG